MFGENRYADLIGKELPNDVWEQLEGEEDLAVKHLELVQLAKRREMKKLNVAIMIMTVTNKICSRK